MLYISSLQRQEDDDLTVINLFQAHDEMSLHLLFVITFFLCCLHQLVKVNNKQLIKI
jgi:hypothetical protein